MINPDLSVGDEIVLVFMEGESGMPPGTKGVVTRIAKDPFEDEGNIIEVTWENKRPLSLLSTTDLWMKSKKEIKESLSMDELHGLKGVFKNFNQKIIMNFFDKLRESGLVNMLESPRFTWSGREYLERFIDLQEMEGFEIDPDDKAELLDAAFEIQMELIRASMNVLEDEGKEDTIENINRVARKLGVDLLKYYMIIKK